MSERFTQTVDIETPELVVVSYTVAGLGSRLLAALIDLAICAATLLIVVLAAVALDNRSSNELTREMANKPSPSTAWAAAVITIMQFVILWGYYVLFEGLNDGQTPGKRFLRLRAVRDGGYSIGFSASAVRNLLRIVDLQPVFTYLIGIASIAVSKSGKRLGDIVAGTIVVREALIRQPLGERPVVAQSEPVGTLTTALSEAEFQLLERWADRRSSLTPERRREVTAQVVARLRHAFPADATGSEGATLLSLLASERKARDQGAAARGATGASRERYSIITTRSPRWILFASKLADAQRKGLKSLGEDGVRDFVSEYRALSADLARLRTAVGTGSASELFYLGRLVAGAHNLLYRDRRRTVRDVLRFIAIDVPTEVRRSVIPISIAVSFLFLPAIIAYTAVVRHPQIAPSFIPVQMLDRAEEGVTRAKKGTGYIPDPEVLRPLMASKIIANNVQVTFAAFAFGITAGIGTLMLLLFNGVSLGGVFGLYQSKGILKLLLAFVAPHSVLELSAICIAGGGGLLIAAALLVPGNRTRRRALAENSRRAMHLIAASTLLLIVAGSLEGLVSPIPSWPLWAKASVAAVTAVMLVLYLRGGIDREVVVVDNPDRDAGADLLSLGRALKSS
jgi:uncharacterized membrane protein SpoIIM required for sporulation/uncharacterized RDD family membrane protein YckC